MALTPIELRKAEVTAEEMVGLLKLDIQNELEHMMFYLMNAASVQGLHRGHMREFLAKEAASEMEHVRAFTDKLVALAGHYEVPQTAQGGVTHRCPKAILERAIELESEVVQNYALRLHQCVHLAEKTDKPFWTHLGLFYEEQIEHSHTDLDNLHQMVAGV